MFLNDAFPKIYNSLLKALESGEEKEIAVGIHEMKVSCCYICANQVIVDLQMF